MLQIHFRLSVFMAFKAVELFAIAKNRVTDRALGPFTSMCAAKNRKKL